MKTWISLSIFCIASVLPGLYAQEGPPPEIDMVVRATVSLLMEPENKDLKGFIDHHYSKDFRKSKSPEELEEHLKNLVRNTQGAGAIDVSIQDDLFHIHFSDGVDVSVLLRFSQDEFAKIDLLALEEKMDPQKMTEEEQIQSALEKTVRQIESLAKYDSEVDYFDFIKRNFHPEIFNIYSRDSLSGLLHETGKAVAGAMSIQAIPTEDEPGIILQLRGAQSLEVEVGIDPAEPYLIRDYQLRENSPAEVKEELLPMTWDNFASQIAKEVEKGFSGTILIVSNGQVQLNSGYGYARHDPQMENNSGTVYDIGSVPIDFTRAGILNLIDQGKIRREDSITKFFGSVPEDKKPITIGDLISNKSGLQNFHHDEEKDADYDLTWIDREEAIRRILGRPLLAEPGSEVIYSHSAFTLLAAVMEIVSGKSYENFISEQFFQPMGMKNTGSYGGESGMDKDAQAEGYGNQAASPNIPYGWGRTSWLIKGSGGMVSNPGDLYLWYKELQTGNYLSPESMEEYGFGQMALGGSDRGFFTCLRKDSSGTVIICSNSDPVKYQDTLRLFKSLLVLIDK
ncbi:MAG: serine hydrolase [Saprospiraceae bacterium]|nr:serine hydrolase [Saprospiraceae bacterium]